MTPEEIRSLRKNNRLTQEQLATMMQVDSTTIYRWENGIVAPSLVKSSILRDILIKIGDGRTHPFVEHLLSGGQATAVMDLHGVYYKVNDSYEKQLGMVRAALINNSSWEILSELKTAIEDLSSVNLDKFVQGKIACVRAENIPNKMTGKKLDHELHVVAQRDFSTIIVHEIRPSASEKKWSIVTVDPKF